MWTPPHTKFHQNKLLLERPLKSANSLMDMKILAYLVGYFTDKVNVVYFKAFS
jgi:hypothetical protein